jgi:O-antigen ligase
VWSLLFKQSRAIFLVGHRLRVEWVLLGTLAWLLYMADSATSLMCLTTSLLLLVISRMPVVQRGPRRILGLGFFVVLTIVVLEWTTDMSATILHLLGRDSNLTTRMPTWIDLLAMMDTAEKRLLGYGFEIFWETRQGAYIFDKWNVFNAHNGYLDTYLSLGYVGLGVLVACILWTIPKVSRHLAVDRPGAMLRLTLVVVVALYNWTESTFKSVDNMWLLLFLAGIDPPGVGQKARPTVVPSFQRKRSRLSAA